MKIEEDGVKEKETWRRPGEQQSYKGIECSMNHTTDTA